jgi:hypothetical protein
MPRRSGVTITIDCDGLVVEQRLRLGKSKVQAADGRSITFEAEHLREFRRVLVDALKEYEDNRPQAKDKERIVSNKRVLGRKLHEGLRSMGVITPDNSDDCPSVEIICDCPSDEEHE